MVAAFEVQAEFRQFYLMDDEHQPPMPEAISSADLSARVRVAPHIAVLHTLDEGPISVAVEVGDNAPSAEHSEWEHVVDFSINAPSGAIVLAGSAAYVPNCPRIRVPSRPMRGRAHFGRSSATGPEHCRIVFWPEPESGPHVLKRRANAS